MNYQEDLVFNRFSKKDIFIITIILSFISILIYNFFTPLMSDDLLSHTNHYTSFADIIKAEYIQYMTWTGRSVLQMLLKIFSITPKWIFNIFNSFCFILLTLLIYWNIDNRGKYNVLLYMTIQLLVWNFGVDFDQTVLWLGGACNYLWGTALILAYITCLRYYLYTDRIVRHPVILSIFLLLLGCLAGWCNENTSGGGIFIVILFLLIYFIRNKHFPIWVYTGFIGLISGFLLMVSAPGNKSRSALMLAEESHSGLMAYVSRFLKINKAMDSYMMIYICIIVLLVVYFIYRGVKLEMFYSTMVFCLAGIVTSYVLVLTPEPMPRAYFGANIFFTIAAVNCINMIKKDNISLYSLKIGVIVAATIWMFFFYVENGANLARIQREVNEREDYILEQTAAGNYDLTLPMIRTEFETKYSFIYQNDLSTDEDFWINEVFRIRYGINSLKVVTRDEWDEIIDR